MCLTEVKCPNCGETRLKNISNYGDFYGISEPMKVEVVETERKFFILNIRKKKMVNMYFCYSCNNEWEIDV